MKARLPLGVTLRRSEVRERVSHASKDLEKDTPGGGACEGREEGNGTASSRCPRRLRWREPRAAGTAMGEEGRGEIRWGLVGQRRALGLHSKAFGDN